MPIYSYICNDCKEKSDLLVGVGEKDEKLVCKKCGSKNIERTYSSFGVGSSSSEKNIGSDASCPTGTCPFN